MMNDARNGRPGFFPHELTEKRSGNVKVFQLDRKHYQAVVYPMPVHKQEANGKWIEIDRNFYHEGSVLCSTNASLQASCRETGSVPFITLREANGFSFSYGIKNAGSVIPAAENVSLTSASDIESLREKPLYADGAVRYPDILPDIDLVCRSRTDGFKDELIYRDLASVQPVTFTSCTSTSESGQMSLNSAMNLAAYFFAIE